MNTRTLTLKKGEIIPLNFDYVFTSIFNNEKNISILENFLSVYLEIPVEELKGKVKLKSRYLELESKNSKSKQIDLLLDLDGEKINIELSNNISDGIINRNIVYASNIHGRQLKYGDNTYTKIKRTIQINLSSKHINNKLKETYYFTNSDGKILSKKLQIDVIDMEIGRRICYTNSENKLARWCRVLTSRTEEEFIKSLGDDLMENNAKEMLIDEVNKYSSDEEAVVLYSAYTKEELEKNTLLEEAEELGLKRGMEEGLKQGIEKGIEQGKREKQLEIAKHLLEQGVSIDIIRISTQLNDNEIEELK